MAEVRASREETVLEVDANSGAEDQPDVTKKESIEAVAPETMTACLKDVFINFLPLGLLAFGGPSAHIALLHERFVERQQWLSEEEFLEIMAVGQGLPGPTSTQMVVSVGTVRGGILGGLLAFFLWNIPSAIVLILAGLGVDKFIDNDDDPPDWMSGLAPAAVSLVFVAAYKLGNKVNTTKLKFCLSIVSCVIVLIVGGDEDVSNRSAAWVYPPVLVAGGLVTLAHSRMEGNRDLYTNVRGWEDRNSDTFKRIKVPLYLGALLALTWAVLLGFFVIGRVADDSENAHMKLFESFFRTGSLIYGGGQVVLPMLMSEVVEPGWVTEDQFFQGFALVQALPGPLFNFSAFLGSVYKGLPGAVIAWVGLFGPGVTLIFAFLPFWEHVRKNAIFKTFLAGVNAAAIGLVVAACPILWSKAVGSNADAAVALITGFLVVILKAPAPLAIITGGFVGFVLSNGALSIGLEPYCVEDL